MRVHDLPGDPSNVFVDLGFQFASFGLQQTDNGPGAMRVCQYLPKLLQQTGSHRSMVQVHVLQLDPVTPHHEFMPVSVFMESDAEQQYLVAICQSAGQILR